jgi:PPM family protein phosphatase
MLDDEAIARIMALELPLEQKSIQLVDAANANGGRDNISVLLAQANSGSRKKGLISRWLGQ